MRPEFTERRVLIWGKTYPELSDKYNEVVCTGGVLEDGTPVRIYPMPFRYKDEELQYSLYQWVTVAVAKSLDDHRPESHRIDVETLQLGTTISPDNEEWYQRQQAVFRNTNWQFNSVDDLLAAQKERATSLGVVEPKKILSVFLEKRSDDEAQQFAEKHDRLARRSAHQLSQQLLFGDAPPRFKGLEYLHARIGVEWLCGSGARHRMQILDWGTNELLRREGEQKALDKVRDILDLDRHAVRFFLGNLAQHPRSFTIVGLWYPKRRKRDLFSEVLAGSSADGASS